MPVPIIFIMGVSGSGKTTIGKMLSGKTGMPFFDGDDFHPEANKEKMRSGIPLTDQDRAGWLLRMNELARNQAAADGAVIACSGLKEKYRAIVGGNISAPVTWIFLKGDFELIEQRMKQRKGHYMPSILLASQFEILEEPANCITIDIAKNPEEMVAEITHQLKLQE